MGNGAATKRAARPSEQPEGSESQELHERIAQRAYEIFESRGRTAGHDLEDWLEAEQEILSEQMDTDLG